MKQSHHLIAHALTAALSLACGPLWRFPNALAFSTAPMRPCGTGCRENVLRLHSSLVSFGDQIAGQFNDTTATSLFAIEEAPTSPALPTSTSRYMLPLQQGKPKQQLAPIQEGSTVWKETLSRASSIASFFCILDCTLLPLMTMALPLLGLGNFGGILDHRTLCHLGHQMALNVVIPIGTVTTSVNYLWNGRSKRFLTMGYVGILFIFVANSCHNPRSWLLPILNGMQINGKELQHALSHGLWHKIINLSGCAILWMSNHFAKQFTKNASREGKFSCLDPRCFFC